MSPEIALLTSATVALGCATIAYVARLHYSDRATERAKVESKLAGELDAVRRKLAETEKTAREAHAMAAARATGRIRN